MRSFKVNKHGFIVIILLTIMWGVLANPGIASAHSVTTHQDFQPHAQRSCLLVSAKITSFDTRIVYAPPGGEWEYDVLMVITNGCGHIDGGGGDVRSSVTCASGVSNSFDTPVVFPQNTSQRTFSYLLAFTSGCTNFENGIPVHTSTPAHVTVHINVAVDITNDGSVFSIANTDVNIP